MDRRRAISLSAKPCATRRTTSHSVWDDDGEDEFAVVAPEDVDTGANRISSESPLGRALLGRRIGDRVRFRTPGGIVGVTVLGVS